MTLCRRTSSGSPLPLLEAVSTLPNLRDCKPFAGVGVAALLHLRPSLVAMVRAWIGLGASAENVLVLAKDYTYPERSKVCADLEHLGVKVIPVTEILKAIPAFLARLAGRQFIVVEDGGHVMPEVAEHGSLIGGIEQTTKGIRRCLAAGLRLTKPLLSLPASTFKSKFEPPHIADVAIESIQRLLSQRSNLADMRVCVIGAAGTIGSHLIDALVSRCREVVAYDSKEPPGFRLQSFKRHKVAASTRDAVAGCDLVIGCTGECVLRADDVMALKDGVFLASTGSEQTEFPVQLLEYLSVSQSAFAPDAGLFEDGAPNGTTYVLRANGNKVTLLNDGRPVNFSRVSPPEPVVFDLIMGAILVGSIELAKGKFHGLAGFRNAFDEIVDRHQLEQLFLALHGQGVIS